MRKSRRSPDDEQVAISIAHNVRKQGKNGKSVTAPLIIAHLGNEDTVDPDALDALMVQLTKIRDARRAALAQQGVTEPRPAEAQAVRDAVQPAMPRLRLLCSKAYGVRMLLDVAWRELGLGPAIRTALPERVRDKEAAERMIFGMVWARAEAPQSKLATVDWLKERAHLPGVEDWDVDMLYQTLDHLRRAWPKIEEHLVADVVRTRQAEEIAHVLADATAIFTEADMDDVARAEIRAAWDAYRRETGERPDDPLPQVVNDPPLRMRGHSKDGHPHDPQVVMGVAMFATGEVLTHQLFPGNTADKVVNVALFDQVRRLLPKVALNAVMDAGMGGNPNLAWLHEQGMGWIAGTTIRQNKLLEEVLAGELAWTPIQRTTHRNRKPDIATWSVSLVAVPVAHRAVAEQAENLVLVKNPDRARRDLRMIDRHVEEVTQVLAKSDALEQGEILHAVLRDPELRRYVRVTDDKVWVEIDPDAPARRVGAVERQIKTVERQLASGVAVERDGVPHPLLRHPNNRHLVRVSGDRVVLDELAVAAARAGVIIVTLSDGAPRREPHDHLGIGLQVRFAHADLPGRGPHDRVGGTHRPVS